MNWILVLLSLVLSSMPLLGQDTKAAADALVHQLRARQNADGSYGENLAETCRVLDVLARSPRRYSELDGPFFRNAARCVLQAEPGALPDALIVLALGGAISPPLVDARNGALGRLTEEPAAQLDVDAIIVLRTHFPGRTEWPAAADDDPPARRVLLADDPASVDAPPVTAVAAWTEWARAARMRGVIPGELPPLPAMETEPGVGRLVRMLETVIQLHGLRKPAAPPLTMSDTRGRDESGTPAPPERVAPGQALPDALGRAASFFDSRQEGGTFGLDTPGWTGPQPGITALCLSAAIAIADHLGLPPPSWIDAGLDYLAALQKPDGSIREEGLDVYTTSVAIEALVTGGRDRDKAVIERARMFLLLAQSDEGEGYQPDIDSFYGGVGYGNDERPDLSNTQMAVEAAARAGTPSDDPFFAKARVFLERCQNLSERGAMEWPRTSGGRIVMGNDGGSTYYPGSSEAGEERVAEGVYQARSYGSMTYALVKSYMFCDVLPGDPRLAAAIGWLARNFTVDHNPGFATPEAGADGLYYYYLAMARTLRLLPPESFRDEAGERIVWEPVLQRHLLDRQRTDGSWINEHSPRWWEGAPTLCTAYAILALDAASD